jgi:hypothetical protein
VNPSSRQVVLCTIVDLMDGTDLRSEAADDSMPGLGEGEGNNKFDDDGVYNEDGEHPDDEVAAANADIDIDPALCDMTCHLNGLKM